MENWVRIESGVVEQRQPYAEEGFVEAPAHVVCGMVFVDGEFVAPDPGPQSPPEVVTRLQLARALRGAELKPSFDAAMVQASAEVQEDWRLAVEIRRDDSLVEQIGAAMGLSAGDVDELFVAAANM